eukprot:gnl/Chilomastix_cuspidata/4378.p3 GENE.gnl/Chilomastix_cuspidata/4378~~gnl/Chilomastix_cuspidata/4378.p3  ORF type:complete len:307 (+),score=50.95 gnl/Chilomastix_cuspidata/4378:1794-2714(+)
MQRPPAPAFLRSARITPRSHHRVPARAVRVTAKVAPPPPPPRRKRPTVRTAIPQKAFGRGVSLNPLPDSDDVRREYKRSVRPLRPDELRAVPVLKRALQTALAEFAAYRGAPAYPTASHPTVEPPDLFVALDLRLRSVAAELRASGRADGEHAGLFLAATRGRMLGALATGDVAAYAGLFGEVPRDALLRPCAWVTVSAFVGPVSGAVLCAERILCAALCVRNSSIETAIASIPGALLPAAQVSRALDAVAAHVACDCRAIWKLLDAERCETLRALLRELHSRTRANLAALSLCASEGRAFRPPRA